jgi:hypothetical protein
VNINASGPIRIQAVALLNTTAAVAYLQMFRDIAANVTLGTTVPNISIGLPANGGISFPLPDGWLFGKDKVGCSCAGTTLPTNAIGAGISVNIIYGG